MLLVLLALALPTAAMANTSPIATLGDRCSFPRCFSDHFDLADG